jgi:predicted transposase/invertase (TIGR01784 family)
MEEERLNPLNDYLFMKYMGEQGDEEQLIAFLNVVLQKTGRGTVMGINIREDRAISADFVGDKSVALDLRATISDGTKVNIEVQLCKVGNMDKRSLFYWSRDYVEDFKAGGKYKNLPDVININILGEELHALKDFHSSFHLWDDVHKDCMLTNALEIHFIDMVKFRRLKEIDIVNNGMHRWLTFFDKNTNQGTIKKIIEMDTAIKKANEVIVNVAQNKDMLRLYRLHEKVLSDYANGMDNAKEEGIGIGKLEGIVIGKQEGIVIGKQEGKQEKTIDFVLKLHRRGESIDDIAELVDISSDEVRSIFKARGLA